MKKMSRIGSALSVAYLLLACAWSPSLFAQTSRGTVTGSIADPSSAAIPNASVELKNTATNVVRTTTTNSAGLYRFDAVDPGAYQISTTASGFKGAQTTPFEVTGAQLATLDIKLEIGTQASTVDVVSAAEALLQTESPVRGASIGSKQTTELPIANRNSVTLALTVPGVATSRFGVGGTGSFSVNGARNRSNNFMIDGMENNDISIAGQAFTITNPDTVQETSIQTTNFDAEYGRAGGAVVNVITKSGTNQLHGTASWLLDVTNDDAITNTQGLDPNVIARGKPLPGTEDIWAGTLGGPIKKDRTFFFAGYQYDVQRSSGSATAPAPTAAGFATLNALFPTGTNPRVDLYRQVLGSTVATSQFANVALGSGRPPVEFGTAVVAYANLIIDKQWSIKIDHRLGDKDLLSGRYSNDTNPQSPATLSYPGFFTNLDSGVKNTTVSETHIFSPTITNELRLGYNRINLSFPVDATNALAQNLPNYTIAGLPASTITSFGVASNIPQGRLANNYVLQDTISIVRGRHTIRAGFDILDQRSRQFAPINIRGTLSYQASNIGGVAYTGFANFVDDFGGSSGSAAKTYGSNRYYPSLVRSQFFGTDRWRVNQSLTVTLGLRYEYPGTALNSLTYPAYTGLFNVNPVTLAGPWNQPNSIKPDKNNFAPSVGLAWTPSSQSGLMSRILGEKKTVIRTGYSIGYDSFYNNIASNAATASPAVNASSTISNISASLPRGLSGLSGVVPPPSILTPNLSENTVAPNLVSPYYQKWSFGIQRELPWNTILDISYVGTKGTKLFMTEDQNPVVPTALQILPAAPSQLPYNSGRLDPLQGIRQTRTNGGSSYYHGLQVSASRHFMDHFLGTASYTRSKTIDYVSDPFTTTGINVLALSAVPTVFGGLAREKAVSLIDRPNRFVLSSVYELPFMREQKGLLGNAFGGWQISGTYTIESGVPYTVVNGIDADGIGGNNDRPDANPNGIRGVRAVPNASSPTGYVNPDLPGSPAIDPKTAQYVVLPANSGRTGNAGRNTERTPGQNNVNASFFKYFKITEKLKMELRAETYNTLNHPQLGTPSVSPFAAGVGSLSSNAATGLQGRFLNPTFMDGGGRVIRYQLKFTF
jgi:Carboxypeptidase regulatory-like domain/TonB-dependent Receptor Plug Domain